MATHGFFDMSDRQLVDEVAAQTRSAPQAGAVAEIQRRQIVAINALNRSSTLLALVMIALTIAILILTAVMVWR
jgi:hypothetical protein